MEHNVTIKGHQVYFEEDARQGVRYLLDDLDYNEARVFFDQARARGEAHFENDNEGQFTLLYKNGRYTLVRR